MSNFVENLKKIDCVKCKYKIHLLDVYLKILKLKFFKTKTEWLDVFSKLLEDNENKLNDLYVEDINIIFNANSSDEDKNSCYTYILALSHSEILKDCIEFLKKKDRKQLKTFLNEIYTYYKDELDELLLDFKTNEVNIDDIQLILKDTVNEESITPMILVYIDMNDEDGDDEEYVFEEDDHDDFDFISSLAQNKGFVNHTDDKQFDHQSYNKRSKEKSLEKQFLDLFKQRNKKPTTAIESFSLLTNDEKTSMIKELKDINMERNDNDMYMRVLKSKLSSNEKKEILIKLDSQNIMSSKGKFNEWFESIISFPFGKYVTTRTDNLKTEEDISTFLNEASLTLDKVIYGHAEAKHKLKCYLSKMISNPKGKGNIIGIHGCMGTGKTTLIEHGISKILGRPFISIPLGGAQDGSYLKGHGYTYEGSMPGHIVQVLKEKGCLNPVIYFDELDKISDTPKGEEIAGILTHLTDTSQNSQFHDKYFAEIDFDLSKCLFIFSYNDESKINPILRDRMYRIHTKGYDRKQKIIISNNYLLPKIREQVMFDKSEIIIPDETIGYIIENHCNKEDGVRNMKRCLEIIHTKLNLYRLMKPGFNLFEEDMSLKVNFPFTITPAIVDKLIKKPDINMSYQSMYF